ncbi:MAG: Maf family protein [Paracoccaceae bacterium]
MGGYKIEEKGLRLFDKIDGDYFSILGLPLLDIVRFFDANGVLEN